MKTKINTSRHTYATPKHAAVDLGLAENPLGPSPKAVAAIIDAANKVHLYPDKEEELIALIAKHHGISENSILLGAGANELLEDYLKVLALGKNIVAPTATFPESIACMTTFQGSVTSVSLTPEYRLDLKALLQACSTDTRLIHICNPNNPTGIWEDALDLWRLAEQSPAPLLISETGADFIGQSMIGRYLHKNIIIVRSFSKAYGLAGLRLGYSVASPETIARMKCSLRSYRANSIALAAAIAAIQDQEHLQKSVAYILEEKAWLMREMSQLGFQVVPSQGQTFIAKVPNTFTNADHFCAMAKQHNVAVVNCSLYPGLKMHVRISPQRRNINKKFIEILKLIKRSVLK